MDLLIGRSVSRTGIALRHDPFPTIVFRGNYTTMPKTRLFGNSTEIVTVFFNQGHKLQSIHAALRDHNIESNIFGWFKASPGQIVDEVHARLNPESCANVFMRSADKVLAMVDSERAHAPHGVSPLQTV